MAVAGKVASVNGLEVGVVQAGCKSATVVTLPSKSTQVKTPDGRSTYPGEIGVGDEVIVRGPPRGVPYLVEIKKKGK